MAPSSQIKLMRHAARSVLSRDGHLRILPSSFSSSSSLPSSHYAAREHGLGPQQRRRQQQQQQQQQPGQRRTYSAVGPTRPLRAQPNKYVTGVTPDQVSNVQELRDWYSANFVDWEDEPDRIIVRGTGEGAEAREGEGEDDDEEDEVDGRGGIILPEGLTKRNVRPLVAYLREPGREEGSRNCYRLRNPGINDPNFPLIPGMLHGSDPTRGVLSIHPDSKIMVKTPWFEIQRELDRYHHGINGSFVNRVYALTVYHANEAHLDHHRSRVVKKRDRNKYTVDDEKMAIIPIPPPSLPVPPPRTPVPGLVNVLVVPADLQMHPVGNFAYCLNYIRYHPKKPIKIPVRCVNEEESPAMKRGGFLSMVNRTIECLVDEDVAIPEKIFVECSGLRQKDVVRRNRLIVPDGVRIHPRVAADYLIGTVFGAKGGGGGDDEKKEENEKKK
ncbi:hypothetical protein ACHAXA_001076 [Cyclostephanos tholiformis]|uniref:Large ribosomal subunit protein bL25 beta domain-containing protein n=1 Tax=Cyclostephanos tholiformis TaxID=382380 RepID=A0ABD3R127_9STRA